MTHVCYTLEEAAEKLKLSETVLVRLSQYFKVPKSAYEEMGYLSFKGDLSFSEPDIAFFRQAKERLLNGDSLDDVKKHVQQEAIAQPPQWIETPPRSLESHGLNSEQVTKPADMPSEAPPQASQPEPDQQIPYEADGPIREIQDRKPYEKAAEQSFERYKSMHRSGLSKVFENMLKEVGASASAKKRPDASAPGFRPLRDKRAAKPEPSKAGKASGAASLPPSSLPNALLPFSRNPMTSGSENKVRQPVLSAGSWEHLIQEAASQPRVMNTQLKNAAQILRQRAIGEPAQDERTSS